MIPFEKLPALNASLNALTTVLLVTGYCFIRAKNILAHKICMGMALLTSALFLTSYITYHSRIGVTKFPGTGWIRPVYFTILVSHTMLAVIILPLAFTTIFRAWKGQFDRHVRIARWTLPIWLYVSVTGVVIYFLLYHFKPGLF